MKKDLLEMYKSGECGYCGKVYIRKKNLINHLSTKHPESNKLWLGL